MALSMFETSISTCFIRSFQIPRTHVSSVEHSVCVCSLSGKQFQLRSTISCVEAPALSSLHLMEVL